MTCLTQKALCSFTLALAAPTLAAAAEGSLQLAPPSAIATAAPAPAAQSLPPPFDRHGELVGRYLDWLAAETGAPADPPWPPVTVEHLPPTVRMGFFFPSAEAPWQEMRIAVSPRSIDRAAGEDGLAVLGELAHEYAHYAQLMQENGWQTELPVFAGGAEHHCDPEFVRLTSGMAEMIWNSYHSSDAVRSIAFMNDRACSLEGAAGLRAVR